MKRSYIFTILAVLLMAVIAFLFFYPDAMEGKVLQQHDIQQGLANGQEGKAFTEATGETTRWTNSLFGGMPNFQISPSYPSSDLISWITKLYGLGLPSPANLLFMMMVGFFIMLLCMRMKWYTALLGAIGWGFSTYFIIIIGAGHIWKFVTLTFIPPTIGGIILCYRGRYVAGTALASLFGALQLQANHPQMSYYFLFVIFFMVLAYLWSALKEKNVRRWAIATGCVVAAGVLGVVANSPSLYNTYEYSKETIRGRKTEIVSADAAAMSAEEKKGLDFDYITAWSYGPDETLTLLIPNVKGGATLKPIQGLNYPLSVTETDYMESRYNSGQIAPEEMQWMGQFCQYFGNQPMTNGPVYVGAIIFMLAILALFVVEGPMKWALFASTVLSILLAWGHNFAWLSELFIDYFPGYNKFRTVSSILVIAEFTLPLLAMMCVNKMLTTPDFFARYKKQFYGVMGVGVLICFLGWIAPSLFGNAFSASELKALTEMGAFSEPMFSGILHNIREARLSLVSDDAFRSLMVIMVGVILMVLYWRGIIKKGYVLVAGLAVLTLVDLYTVNKRYVNSDNFVVAASDEAVFEPTAVDLQILQDTTMNYRVMDYADFGGARSSYFHKTIGGYHAAKLTRYNDLIEHQINKGNIGVLNMLNARYFIGRDEAGQTVCERNPDAMGNAWFVDQVDYVASANEEMSALTDLAVDSVAVADKAFEAVLGKSQPKMPGDTIYETTYAPNRLTYHAQTQKGGVAVFSEVYFPWGWKATVDGKDAEIGRVNYVLRALNLPAGSHTIEFVFDPESIHVTDTMATISIIIIYLLCGGALFMLYRQCSCCQCTSKKKQS
ncbi:MAG: YfhO family protein [Muribaculaceae bacterium]|nr:YfhO family protein [Muribaculaceae bacterium]